MAKAIGSCGLDQCGVCAGQLTITSIAAADVCSEAVNIKKRCRLVARDRGDYVAIPEESLMAMARRSLSKRPFQHITFLIGDRPTASSTFNRLTRRAAVR